MLTRSRADRKASVATLQACSEVHIQLVSAAPTREGHVPEHGGAPAPPQGQHAVLGHGRADAGPQLAVGQPARLHLGPDQLQRADHRHGAH